MNAHTPTPWTFNGKLHKDNEEGYSCYVTGMVDGEHTGMIAPSECRLLDTYGKNIAEANAKFIVKAVNSHDKLLNILQDCENFLLSHDPQSVSHITISTKLGERITKLLKELESEG